MQDNFDLEKFCVFECDQDLLAVNAIQVRHIASSFELTSVPLCDPCMAGLTLFRSELIPVLSWNALSRSQSALAPDLYSQLLIFDHHAGPWAFGITQVIDLVNLDFSLSSSYSEENSWKYSFIGNATHKSRVVQVIDPNRVFTYAQRLLEVTGPMRTKQGTDNSRHIH